MFVGPSSLSSTPSITNPQNKSILLTKPGSNLPSNETNTSKNYNFASYVPPSSKLTNINTLQVNPKQYTNHSKSFSIKNMLTYNPANPPQHTDDFLQIPKKIDSVEQTQNSPKNDQTVKKKSFYPKSDVKIQQKDNKGVIENSEIQPQTQNNLNPNNFVGGIGGVESTSRNRVQTKYDDQDNKQKKSRFFNRSKSPTVFNRNKTENFNRGKNNYRVSQIPYATADDIVKDADPKKNNLTSKQEQNNQNIKTIQKTQNSNHLTDSFGPTSKFQLFKLNLHNPTLTHTPILTQTQYQTLPINNNISSVTSNSNNTSNHYSPSFIPKPRISPNKTLTPTHSHTNIKPQPSLPSTTKPSFIPSKKSISRFHIIKPIGSSKFSQAFLCVDKKTLLIYCLKKIQKSAINQSTSLLNQFIRKISLQFTSSHPNIIQIYDVFSDNQFVYLVQEYMEGGSLREYLNKQKQKNKDQTKIVRDYGRDQATIVQKLYNIDSALCYIHNNENQRKVMVDRGVPKIHGDLRPETILMSLDSCKISPINPIKIEKALSLFHPYICPQALAQQNLTPKSDMWNLGLIIFQLCTKRSLFKIKQYQSNPSLTDQIVNTDLNKQIGNIEGISHSVKELIRFMLKIRPDQRLSSEQIINSHVIKMFGLRSQQLQGKKHEGDQCEIERFRMEIKSGKDSPNKKFHPGIKPSTSYTKKIEQY